MFMSKINYLYILFLFLQFFAYSIENDEGLNELCMNLWTTIDLVRAINIKDYQKDYFLNKIFDNLLNIYAEYKYNKFRNKLCNEKNLIEILDSVKENFHEVFANDNNKAYISSCFILEKLLCLLKSPSNINSN